MKPPRWHIARQRYAWAAGHHHVPSVLHRYHPFLTQSYTLSYNHLYKSSCKFCKEEVRCREAPAAHATYLLHHRHRRHLRLLQRMNSSRPQVRKVTDRNPKTDVATVGSPLHCPLYAQCQPTECTSDRVHGQVLPPATRKQCCNKDTSYSTSGCQCPACD